MGNSNTSPTFNFFSDNFGIKHNFILDFQDKRLLFSYRDEDITETFIKINMELLDRPNSNSSVTLRSLGNCQCKSDAKKYEPSITFNIYREKDGIFNIHYNEKTTELKILIKDLEKAILDY